MQNMWIWQSIFLSLSLSLFESSSSPNELYLVGLLVEKGKDPLFEFKTMAPWDFFFLAVGVVFLGLGFHKRSTKHDTLRPFFLGGGGEVSMYFGVCFDW
jgi:hypothetical protein